MEINHICLVLFNIRQIIGLHFCHLNLFIFIFLFIYLFLFKKKSSKVLKIINGIDKEP